MSSHLSAYLSTLKSTQLKRLALLTSIPNSGTKSDLISRLAAFLPQPLLPRPPAKILSLDMGIRNLGLCIASVTFPPPPTSPPCPSPTPSASLSQPHIHVLHWSRLTLFPGTKSTSSPSPSPSPSPSSPSSSPHDRGAGPSPFSPGHLAPLAHSLVTRTLLPHAPSTLLLERQRHRTGGAAAVQEWTVRVNALEAMVWAVLETIKQQRQQGQGERVGDEQAGFPECWAIEPARVARFWLDGGRDMGADGGTESELWKEVEGVGNRQEKEGAGRTRRKPAEVKKRKIALVRKWLGAGDAAPFVLSFADQAAEVRDAVLQPPRKKTSGKLGKGNFGHQEEQITDIKFGKLDDVADCFLQAVTWLQWDWNRRRILHALESRVGG
ncbi:MAG: hypothetical protein M1821_005986 [Bathelium mastoideum]|nr:MAG: hypothetical protein M1821_005986 [Bathelium mastoideum]